MPPKQKPTKPKNPPYSPPPEVGLKWSKNLLLWIFAICVILAFGGVFGYLFYKELKKTDAGEYQLPKHRAAPDSKNYSNDYWGFKFQYPGNWWPAIGSFEDGEYFFASEPINFAKELGSGQVMMEIKTYNNWKHLSFADWLSDLQTNYLPQGVIVQKNLAEFKNWPSVDYTISLKKPINQTAFWHVIAISKNEDVKYLFILESDTAETGKKFEPQFQSILNGLELYEGFGVN